MPRLLLFLSLLFVGQTLHAQESTVFLQGATTCDYQQFPFGSFSGTFAAEGMIDTSDFSPEDLQGVGGALFPDSTGAGETLFWASVVVNPDTTLDALGMFLTAPEGFNLGSPAGVTGGFFFVYRADTLVLPEIGDSLDIEEILGAVEAEHKLIGLPTGLEITARDESSLSLEYGGFLADMDQVTFIVSMTNGVVDLEGFSVDVDEQARRPESLVLAAPRPNPFNPSTRLGYSLARPGSVELAVYNLQGRLVQRLAEGYRPAGDHEVLFKAGHLASGVYLVRLEALGAVRMRALTLVK